MKCDRSALILFLSGSVTLGVLGCRIQESAEREPEVEEQSVSVGMVRLAEEAQQIIGLETVSARRIALLPLVVWGDLPGHEIEHPMAIVIVGGLVSSTFLTLFLLPVLYHMLGRSFGESAAIQD